MQKHSAELWPCPVFNLSTKTSFIPILFLTLTAFRARAENIARDLSAAEIESVQKSSWPSFSLKTPGLQFVLRRQKSRLLEGITQTLMFASRLIFIVIHTPCFAECFFSHFPSSVCLSVVWCEFIVATSPSLFLRSLDPCGFPCFYLPALFSFSTLSMSEFTWGL